MNQKMRQINLVCENAFSGRADVRKMKDIIQGLLYPKNPEYFSPGAMMLAARTFANYGQSGGTVEEAIDLMLFYVECGTQFTCDYGDMDEDFYMALETVFEDSLKLIKKAGVDVFDQYKDRLRAIESATCDIGWGYGDQIEDLLNIEFPGFLGK